jgi:predicted permease
VIARLGHVIGWAGNTIAALIIIAMGISIFTRRADGSDAPLAIVAALLVFLFGRACRYVLSGPKVKSIVPR